MPITCCHSSPGYCQVVALSPATPAEQTRASIRPKALDVALAAASTLATSATSTTQVSVALPSIDCALFNFDGSLSQRLTLPPLATSRCAIASPMPAAPPVMTAVRPSKSSRFIARAPIEICGSSYHAPWAADIVTRCGDGLRRRGRLEDIRKNGRQPEDCQPRLRACRDACCDSIDSGRRQLVRRRPAIASGIEIVVPVRRDIVKGVHFRCPRRVRHRRPMILVEPGRIL